ncbi:MAG TPA: NAD(P)-binding domain-containing protein [Propionibacteriaceae bacterium]|nr:NAD(P)-binding domain-containing protein [Propionibacteriaceae bacterium]
MTERLGILGAGKLGTAVARLAVDAGRQVLISDVRDDAMVQLVVSTIAAGARLVPADEMLSGSDIVLLAIPYSHLGDLDLGALTHVVVVDATNAWLEVDGADPPSSPLHGRTGLRLVRTLNHLAYEDLIAYAEPKGAPYRTAVAVASDDVDARASVAGLVDDLGFDPVEIDGRSAWMLESNGPFFGRRLAREEMSALVSASRRADRLTW